MHRKQTRDLYVANTSFLSVIYPSRSSHPIPSHPIPFSPSVTHAKSACLLRLFSTRNSLPAKYVGEQQVSDISLVAILQTQAVVVALLFLYPSPDSRCVPPDDSPRVLHSLFVCMSDQNRGGKKKNPTDTRRDAQIFAHFGVRKTVVRASASAQSIGRASMYNVTCRTHRTL